MTDFSQGPDFGSSGDAESCPQEIKYTNSTRPSAAQKDLQRPRWMVMLHRLTIRIAPTLQPGADRV